jgi:hypothetical protein
LRRNHRTKAPNRPLTRGGTFGNRTWMYPSSVTRTSDGNRKESCSSAYAHTSSGRPVRTAASAGPSHAGSRPTSAACSALMCSGRPSGFASI